jgi:hypothetical protein
LITVYSTADKGYRSIPIEGIISANLNGFHYVVKGKERMDEADDTPANVEESYLDTLAVLI